MTSRRQLTNLPVRRRVPLPPLIDAVAREYSSTVLSVAMAFVSQAALLISGVIVARLLSVENRGHLALLALGPLILSQVGALGLPLAVAYYIARDPRRGRLIVQRSLRILIFAIGAGMGVHALILAVLLRDQSSAVAMAGIITLLATPAAIVYLYGLAILQGQQRFWPFNLLRLMQAGCYAVALLPVLFAGSSNIIVIAVAYTGSQLAAGALSLRVISSINDTDEQGDAPTGREMLTFGMKSLPGYVSPVDTFRIDQLVLGAVAGPSAVGIYVVGVSFAYLPRLVAQSVGIVASPKIASRRTDGLRLVVRFTALTIAGCGVLALALALAAGHLVPVLFGPEYESAASVTRVALLAAFIISIRRVLSDCARGLGRPIDGTLAEVAGFGVALPALALFSREWGAEGAAWAAVLGALVNVTVLTAFLTRFARSASRTVSVLQKAA